jgi:hypothetical protein
MAAHMSAGRGEQERDGAFKILDGLRAADGTLTRVRTVCHTVARLAPAGAGGGLAQPRAAGGLVS